MTGYIIIAIFFILNVIAFFLFAHDKHCAVVNDRRIPEFWLLFIPAIGGSFGALMGMWLFRHKTLHDRFRILLPLFLIIHIIILLVLGYVVDLLPDIYIPEL